MTGGADRTRVVVVGGGFAGIACARALAKHDDIHVTLVDRNDYHQFQPLLYQVATSMLAPRDIAYPLRKIAAEYDDFEAKRGDVVAIDPTAHSVTTDTGETYSGDYLVLAAGSQPNFFGTPGAEHAFPLYSLDDAERLRRGSSRRSKRLSATRGGRRRSDRLRGRRRWADGGRGRGGPVRDDQHDDGPRVPGARPPSQGAPRRSRPCPAQDVLRQGACLRGRGPPEGRRRAAPGGRRDQRRPRPRDAVGRIDDPDPLRHLGRRPQGRADRGGLRAAAGTGRPDRRRPGLHGRRAFRACSSSATSPTSRPRMARRTRSSARSPCRAAVRPPSTSSPRSRGRRPSRSTTSTRGPWR